MSRDKMSITSTSTLDFSSLSSDVSDNDGDERIQRMKANARVKKGRGQGKELENQHINYDRLEGLGGPGPQRSAEGWIVFVTSINVEASEDDLYDIFSAYGQVKNIHLNVDRATGFVKGYALIKFAMFDEALAAKEALDGSDLLGQSINVDWAFNRESSYTCIVSCRKHRKRKVSCISQK